MGFSLYNTLFIPQVSTIQLGEQSKVKGTSYIFIVFFKEYFPSLIALQVDFKKDAFLPLSCLEQFVSLFSTCTQKIFDAWNGKPNVFHL